MRLKIDNRRYQRLAGLLVVMVTASTCTRGSSPDHFAQVSKATHPPRIKPDYSGLVIPPNIAPLNFSILEEGRRFHAVVRGEKGNAIHIDSRKAAIHIPEKAWRELLQANRGGTIRFEVHAEADKEGWHGFEAITNTVATDTVDSYLIYRKILPFHNAWGAMGLYQRNLQTFEETPLLENRRFKNDCCHCHSVCNNDPSRFSVAIRSQNFGNGLLVAQNGAVRKINGTVGFVAWHPSGRVLACSFNVPILILHSQKNDMRDIADLASWLGYLSPDGNEVKRIPTLYDENRLATFPAWSPDGKYLYCCSAPKLFSTPPEPGSTEYKKVKYDIIRVAYDVERDRWGPPETVLSAQKTGLSAAQIRLSPDGRWLSFCLCDYSCWPTYHPESDLYMIDLKAGGDPGQSVPRKLELNSNQCESMHSWSTNSHWIVFSSKREAPLLNRPHLAFIDAQGKSSKPFIVPQQDPEFYDSYLKSYTIPLFASEPMRVPELKLLEALMQTNNPPLVMPAGTGAKPKVQTNE